MVDEICFAFFTIRFTLKYVIVSTGVKTIKIYSDGILSSECSKKCIYFTIFIVLLQHFFSVSTLSSI